MVITINNGISYYKKVNGWGEDFKAASMIITFSCAYIVWNMENIIIPILYELYLRTSISFIAIPGLFCALVQK